MIVDCYQIWRHAFVILRNFYCDHREHNWRLDMWAVVTRLLLKVTSSKLCSWRQHFFYKQYIIQVNRGHWDGPIEVCLIATSYKELIDRVGNYMQSLINNELLVPYSETPKHFTNVTRQLRYDMHSPQR